MVEVSDKKRLGDLIVTLEIVSDGDLHQALSISKETGLPLGRTLVLSGIMSEEALQALLRCQNLLNQELLDTALAKKAMSMVTLDKISVDDALFRLGWNPTVGKDSVPIGELLVDAGYITAEQLAQTVAKSNTTGLPLGRLLVFSGALTEGLLTGALNAQILIRDGKLSRVQAVEALKEAKQRQVSVEVQLKEKGFYALPSRNCPRLGELLLLCGVISQSELVSALEVGLTSNIPLGMVLCQSSQVGRNVIDAAVKVQNLMAEENMTITDARSVITAVNDGASVEEAFATIKAVEEVQEPASLSLFDFLKNLGRVSDEQVNEAFQMAKYNSEVLSQALLISGCLASETVERAEKCRKLVAEGKLKLEHANVAFDYAERSNISIIQALKELHWYNPRQVSPVAPPAQPVDKEEEKIEAVPESRLAAEKEWEELHKEVSDLILLRNDDKAIEGYLDLLRLAEKNLPDKILLCLDSIAELYTKNADFDQAQLFFEQALILRKTCPDPDGRVVATGYANLGKVNYFRKDFSNATENTKKYIEILSSKLGEEHPDVACGMQNLGNIYYAEENYADALKAYHDGLTICTKALGESHPATVKIKRSFDAVMSVLAQKDEQDWEKSVGGRRDAALGLITGSWRSIPQDRLESLTDKKQQELPGEKSKDDGAAG